MDREALVSSVIVILLLLCVKYSTTELLGTQVNHRSSYENDTLSEFDSNEASIIRYDDAQLWRINTKNTSSEEIAELFERRFDGSVWATNKDFVDVFLEKSTLNDAKKIAKSLNLAYDIPIQNLQEIIDETDDNHKSDRYKRQTKKGLTWDQYYDVTDIYEYMRQLAQKFPKRTKLIEIGRSVENRPLLVLKVSGENSTRSIWMDGGIHAREWISPAAVTYIMDQFVRYWDKQPEDVQSVTWYFLPVLNPDGYQYSRKTDRLWRKNRSKAGNCFGVDLNRNFDYRWTGVGASDKECAYTYRGPTGFSEPESKAMADFLLKMNPPPISYLTFHSYGQYILYPWGYRAGTTPDYKMLRRAGRLAAKKVKALTGADYSVMPAYKPFGPAAGGADDWAKGALKSKFVYTIELRDTGEYAFVLPPKFIRVTSREALVMVKTLSKFTSVNTS